MTKQSANVSTGIHANDSIVASVPIVVTNTLTLRITTVRHSAATCHIFAVYPPRKEILDKAFKLQKKYGLPRQLDKDKVKELYDLTEALNGSKKDDPDKIIKMIDKWTKPRKRKRN